MAEAYNYRREVVTDANGNNAGTALFRRTRGATGEYEFRGTEGRIQSYIRTAAGRATARATTGTRYNRNALAVGGYNTVRRRGNR